MKEPTKQPVLFPPTVASIIFQTLLEELTRQVKLNPNDRSQWCDQAMWSVQAGRNRVDTAADVTIFVTRTTNYYGEPGQQTQTRWVLSGNDIQAIPIPALEI